MFLELYNNKTSFDGNMRFCINVIVNWVLFISQVSVRAEDTDRIQ